MPLYALTLEYDGGPFVGWQRQENGLSVQQVLEEAAAQLNGGVVPASVAAGRTDAGVHAEGQVAQLGIDRDLPPERLREALNFHTRPHPVAVLAAALAPAGWNARFSAIRRGYRYRILNRRARPALERAGSGMCSGGWMRRRCMRRRRGCWGSMISRPSAPRPARRRARVRTLDRLEVSRQGEEVVIVAEARSFLHHQIRNLVGTLLEVGQGKRGVDWPRRVLDGADRTRAGQTAPAEGLCFSFVRYEQEPDWV